MSAVSKNWPSSARGSNAATCEVCGVNWPRNVMARDASGVLRCPDDGAGLDSTTLDRANSAGVRRRPVRTRDSGTLVDPPPTAAEIALNQERLFILFGVRV